MTDVPPATLTAHGLDGDLARGFAIREARQPIQSVGLDAALMIHEDGISTEEAVGYVGRWALATTKEAEQSVRFVTDPTWRAYVITYSAGRELVDGWVAKQ